MGRGVSSGFGWPTKTLHTQDIRTANAKQIREESGEFDSDDPLTFFFYDLLYQGTPPSVLETALQNMDGFVQGLQTKMYDGDVEYVNGWSARNAESVAKRLAEILQKIQTNKDQNADSA